MATDTWLGQTANWNTPSDWSDGIPTATSAVVVNSGEPEVTAPIHVASISTASDDQVVFDDAGASTVSGFVTGNLSIDGLFNEGGSSLAIGGVLDGSITVGNVDLAADTTVTAAAIDSNGITILGSAETGSTPHRATLDIAGSASMGAGTGVIAGSVYLQDDALLEFGSGQITTIASGGDLYLLGTGSYVADAGSLGSNSALHGLRTNDGHFILSGDTQVATNGSFDNANTVYVDNGAELKIGGGLTNSDLLYIGVSYTIQGPPPPATTVETPSNGYQAVIDVSGQASLGVAAGVVDGSVFVANDSLVEFGYGQITTIAADGALVLDGPYSYIADAGNLKANSALSGLRTVDGVFAADDEPVITTGPLAIGAAGVVSVGATQSGYSGDLDIGGALSNNGELSIGQSFYYAVPNAADVAVQATALQQTANGQIDVFGDPLGSNPAYQALLDIAGRASLGTSAGVVDGIVSVQDDAVIEFGYGQITTVAADGSLTLDGPGAFIADAGATTTNSALTNLRANYGNLEFDETQVAIAGSFNNAGTFTISGYGTTSTGSDTTIGGTLTNSGTLNINNVRYARAATFVSAESLNNAGGTIGVGVYDQFSPAANFVVYGSAKNSGTLSVGDNATVTIGGALVGDGDDTINYGGVLSVGSASGGGTIGFNGGGVGGNGGALDITSSRNLGDAISGFATDDTIDFHSARYLIGDSVVYAANSQGTGGVVTIDTLRGAQAAAFTVVGSYTAADFSLSNDGNGGLLVSFAGTTV